MEHKLIFASACHSNNLHVILFPFFHVRGNQRNTFKKSQHIGVIEIEKILPVLAEGTAIKECTLHELLFIIEMLLC